MTVEHGRTKEDWRKYDSAAKPDQSEKALSKYPAILTLKGKSLTVQVTIYKDNPIGYGQIDLLLQSTNEAAEHFARKNSSVLNTSDPDYVLDNILKLPHHRKDILLSGSSYARSDSNGSYIGININSRLEAEIRAKASTNAERMSILVDLLENKGLFLRPRSL
jgi:hypothetical protein